MQMPAPAEPPAHHFLRCLIQPHANPGTFTTDFFQVCASSLTAKKPTVMFILSVHWLPLTGGKTLPPGCLSLKRTSTSTFCFSSFKTLTWQIILFFLFFFSFTLALFVTEFFSLTKCNYT